MGWGCEREAKRGRYGRGEGMGAVGAKGDARKRIVAMGAKTDLRKRICCESLLMFLIV